jgi:protein TonB
MAPMHKAADARMLAALGLSALLHAALAGWPPLDAAPPRLPGFTPIEVVLAGVPATRPVARTPAAAARATPARDAAKVAAPAVSDPGTAGALNDQPLVEARADAASLNNPRPPYPLAARRRGFEGRVLLSAHVRDDGTCIEVRLRQSSGHALLDHAALGAVSRWRFVPARRGDRAVDSWVTVPIVFRLED